MKVLDDSANSELEAFFESYSAVWARNDTTAIASYWDPERFVFYKAEEIVEFYLDWNEVLRYWRHNEQFHSRVLLKFGPLRAVPIAGPWVIAPVFMRWHITFAPDARRMDGASFVHRGTTMAGEDHVLTLLSRASGSWKLCGWSETPDAPISYMTRLYKYAATSASIGLGEVPPSR